MNLRWRLPWRSYFIQLKAFALATLCAFAVTPPIPAAGKEPLPGAERQESLSQAEIDRLSAYESWWSLGGANAEMPRDEASRFAAAVAREEFAGRGPALAHYFLTHRRGATNGAWFFLLGAVGDVKTAALLISAMPDPPEPVDSVVPRHASEIEVAIDSMLAREALRTDPNILLSLEEALAESRALAWGEYPAELLVALIGRLKTPQATELLERLVRDPTPAIRETAARALGKTGIATAERALEGALRGDEHAEVRREAAEALGRLPNATGVAALTNRVRQEQAPQTIDAILKSLAVQQALPSDPLACLELAQRGWDAKVVAPYFECWRRAATPGEILAQANSGSWPVRALALQVLTQLDHPTPRTLSISRQAATPPPALDAAVRDQLLKSAVKVYSHDINGVADRASISLETARLTREAFWEIAGHDMSLALSYADQIKPIYGRYTHIGSFGMSSYLSSQAPVTYAATRRAGQLVGMSGFVLAGFLLARVRRTRKIGAGIAAGTLIWMIWVIFQTGIDEFPPPPMWLFTVSGMAFLMAGLLAGAFAMAEIRTWAKLVAAPFAASAAALVMCGLVYSYGLYPIGQGGWELFFAPIACGVMAFPAALFISIGFVVAPKRLGRRI